MEELGGCFAEEESLVFEGLLQLDSSVIEEEFAAEELSLLL